MKTRGYAPEPGGRLEPGDASEHGGNATADYVARTRRDAVPRLRNMTFPGLAASRCSKSSQQLELMRTYCEARVFFPGFGRRTRTHRRVEIFQSVVQDGVRDVEWRDRWCAKYTDPRVVLMCMLIRALELFFLSWCRPAM